MFNFAEKSTSDAKAPSAGFRWFILVAIGIADRRSAEGVDLSRHKLCCVSSTPREKLRVERRSLSSTFAAGHKSEMGWKKVLSDTILPGLVTGMMIAYFQIAGRFASRREKVKRDVTYRTPAGSRCLRC